MKELKLYCCEICGTNYNNKAEAQACEKNHKAPVKYTPMNWKPKIFIDSGYPLAIIAEFSDGKNLYTRKAVPLMTEYDGLDEMYGTHTVRVHVQDGNFKGYIDFTIGGKL